MSALVFLPRVEAEIVLRGALDEPGYRPHPLSARGRAELEEDWFDELDEDSEGDDVPPPEPDEASRVGPLPIQVHAHHWHRYDFQQTYLLAARQDGDLEIIGVANVQGGPRMPHQGVRRIDVGPWRRLNRPVMLADVTEDLPSRAAADLTRIAGDGHSRPLPLALARAFAAVVGRYAPEIDDLFASLPSRDLRPRVNREEPIRVDAFATALRFFTRSWRQLTPVPDPHPSQFALSVEEATRGEENDYITDDTAIFLDWDRAARSVNGWWEFQHQDRRLWIKNINVSNAEQSTGADLVYVHREPETVVLVQYKLVRRLAKTSEVVFRPDGRLGAQVDRMLAWVQPGRSRNQRRRCQIGTRLWFRKVHSPASSLDGHRLRVGGPISAGGRGSPDASTSSVRAGEGSSLLCVEAEVHRSRDLRSVGPR